MIKAGRIGLNTEREGVSKGNKTLDKRLCHDSREGTALSQNQVLKIRGPLIVL